MRGGDVNDVDVWVVDERLVGAVGGAWLRDGVVGDESLRPLARGGGCDGGDCVGDVGGVAEGGVDEHVPCERWVMEVSLLDRYFGVRGGWIGAFHRGILCVVLCLMGFL